MQNNLYKTERESDLVLNIISENLDLQEDRNQILYLHTFKYNNPYNTDENLSYNILVILENAALDIQYYKKDNSNNNNNSSNNNSSSNNNNSSNISIDLSKLLIILPPAQPKHKLRLYENISEEIYYQ